MKDSICRSERDGKVGNPIPGDLSRDLSVNGESTIFRQEREANTRETRCYADFAAI